jgi:hypothetical protein
LIDELDVVEEHAKTPVDALRDASTADVWKLACALLTLHAVADTACAGVGLPGTDPINAILVWPWNDRLNTTGTLATFHPSVVRVLPKIRTPQVGITLNSLSLQLAATFTDVHVHWRLRSELIPHREKGALNLLLVPWPFVMEASDFCPGTYPLLNLDAARFGFFDFAPTRPFDEVWLNNALRVARNRHKDVHGIVLPEAALTDDEFEVVHNLARRHRVNFVLAGIRRERRNIARFQTIDPARTAREPPVDQDKHHRWRLNDSQIRDYSIAHVLDPAKLWWERIDLPQRAINFFALNEAITLCHLICEDLARIEPVSEVVRSVGPTLLFALLQDGPQIEQRWSARYAGVFADDPGCSVLTLSSLGMSERCRPPGRSISRVIGLWKDAARTAQIELPAGHHGCVLTLRHQWRTEFSADGRSDGGAASHYLLENVDPVI